LERASAQTDLDLTIDRDEVLPPATPTTGRLVEDQLTQAMQGRVNLPYRIDLLKDRGVEIKVQIPQGILTVGVPRNRLYSSTTYIFVMWMVGSSLVLLAVVAAFF